MLTGLFEFGVNSGCWCTTITFRASNMSANKDTEGEQMKTSVVISLLLLAFFATIVVSPSLMAQSLIAGDIVGTVADPSHAVVSNAKVTIKSLDTGSTQVTTTNNEGFYRFSLLKPGRYEVSVSQSGFAPVTQPVSAAVGQNTVANINLSVASTAQTIEVSGSVEPLIITDASINTAFTEQQMQQLPNAGGDITNIAQSSPGASMNNTGGYGNFTVNGLPATSNLFTTNGENNMDPYFNINNHSRPNWPV